MLLEIGFYLLLAIVWQLLVTGVCRIFLARARKSPDRQDDHLVPIIRKLLVLGGYAVAGIFALHSQGIDLMAPLAGAGIVGIAIAMASKSILENLFGAVAIYSRAPFKPGHHIAIDGYEGVVERTSLRDTKIKTSEGALISIPNGRFLNGVVQNNSLSNFRPARFMLQFSTKNATEDYLKWKARMAARMSQVKGARNWTILIRDIDADHFTVRLKTYYKGHDAGFGIFKDRVVRELQASFQEEPHLQVGPAMPEIFVHQNS